MSKVQLTMYNGDLLNINVEYHDLNGLILCKIVSENGFIVSATSTSTTGNYDFEYGKQNAFARAVEKLQEHYVFYKKMEEVDGDTPKSRVIKEKEDLDEKISKLLPVVQGDVVIKEISEVQMSLLKEQHLLMKSYSEILDKRIALM